MAVVEINDRNRFSVFVKTKKEPEYKLLYVWQEWFLTRGIPALIHQSTSGFALYREGLILDGDMYDEALIEKVDLLSRKQQLLLSLIAQELSTTLIAERFGVTTSVISTMKRIIKDKLHIDTDAELIEYWKTFKQDNNDIKAE